MTSQTARIRAQRRADEHAAEQAAVAALEEGGPLYARYQVTLDFAVRLDPITDAQVEAARIEQAAEFPGDTSPPWKWYPQQVLRAIMHDQLASIPVVASEIASTLGEDGDFDWSSWLDTDDEIEDAIARLPLPMEVRGWLMAHRDQSLPESDHYESLWLLLGADHLKAELVDAQIVGYGPWHRHAEQEAPAADD